MNFDTNNNGAVDLMKRRNRVFIIVILKNPHLTIEDMYIFKRPLKSAIQNR